MSGTYTEGGYFGDDDELGYAPAPGRRVTSRKTMGKQLVYDVAYTFSGQGARVTKGDRNGDTWLFMGCSFTFGEGVNDDETLPAYFSAGLGHQANVVNLGFHGYGPHQMLRSLETDRLRPLIDLHDPRARGILIPLQNDPDREIRAPATQALSDIAQ